MPVIIPPPRRARRPEPAPKPKRWTRKECKFLVDNGLLTDRYELIEGEILTKMGHKPPHAVTIRIFLAWLVQVFGPLYIQSQLPINVADANPDYNEPEPDAAVLARLGNLFTDQHPGPEDLLLVAEVSDTTLRFDLTTKAALYARAGIREYWVLDIIGRRIVVHRNPATAGYQEILAYAEEETLSSLARPDATARVADLLPPA